MNAQTVNRKQWMEALPEGMKMLAYFDHPINRLSKTPKDEYQHFAYMKDASDPESLYEVIVFGENPKKGSGLQLKCRARSLRYQMDHFQKSITLTAPLDEIEAIVSDEAVNREIRKEQDIAKALPGKAQEFAEYLRAFRDEEAWGQLDMKERKAAIKMLRQLAEGCGEVADWIRAGVK
jgi:hypothetical protein